MLTRRDLIHSRQFLRRRLLTSFVAHQPDPLEWSGVRLPGATLVSVMVLVIAVAAVGIYGFVRPAGNKQWKSCERVIIEAESGAPYVCGDGVLYPVANFASAALLRGLGEDPIRVARASLTWPRGAVVGIPGAPTVLPRSRDLLTGAWSFCVRPQPAGRPRAVLLVGATASAGAGGAPTPLAPDEAVAVANSTTGQLFVIYQGRRHEVRNRDVVSQALRINQVDTVPVSPAWLATVPMGPALDQLDVPGRGSRVTGLAQVKVGQLVAVVDGDRRRRFVAQPTGLQPVSDLQEALIRATVDDTSAPVQLNPLQLAGVAQLEPMAQHRIGEGRVPAMVPAARSLGVVCSATADASDQRRIAVGGVVPTRDPTAVSGATGPSSAAGAMLADEVVVAPGRGALVKSMASPAAVDGPVYLVTETGSRYALGSASALERLGYSDVPAVPQPSTIVERLAQGPVLSELTLVSMGP